MRRRLLAVLMGAVALIFLFAWMLDRYGRRGPPDETFDAIVVLGCRVHRGGVPSAALRERTRRAVELWKEGRAPVIVLTGGVGANPPSEASAAAAVARKLGVPASALRIEDRSRSTEENARFAAERFGGRRVLIVSDAYHVFRAERVFERYYEHVRGTGTRTLLSTRVYGSVREVIACTIYFGLGRMAIALDAQGDASVISPILDPLTPIGGSANHVADRDFVSNDDDRRLARAPSTPRVTLLS